MKILFKKGLCLIFVMCLLISGMSAFAATEDEGVKLYLVGDSTICNYTDAAAPRTGWGEVLYNCFTNPNMIVNNGVSGASSKSFYTGNSWKQTIRDVDAGDYVIIQFGHNDEGNNAPTPLGSKDTEGTYQYYLNKMAQETLAKKAYPIFVTSVERRNDAALDENTSRLGDRVIAMEDLAEEIGVPVIDMWRPARTLINSMDAASAGSADALYLILDAGEHENYPDGIDDRTHLSRTGAMEMAKIFAAGLAANTAESLNALKGLQIPVESIVDGPEPENPLIINEDFEGNTAGEDILPYRGWVAGGSGADKSIKFWAEPAATEGGASTNMAANFTAVTPSSVGLTEGQLYGMRYDMDTITDGYVNFRYRFRANNIVANEVFFTMICGLSYSTIPATSATLNGSINSDGSALTAGEWYDYDIYIDVVNKKMTVFVDGELIGTAGQTMSGAGDFSRIQMNFSRKTTTAESDVVIDDIVLKKIDEDTYYDTTGVLPVNVVLSEDFTGGVAGNAFPKGTENSPSWNDLYATYNSPVSINFADDPEDATNTVVEIARTQQYLTNKWYYVGKRFGKLNTAGILSDGCYSVKYRMRSTDTDGTIFQFNMWDGQNSIPINFDFNLDKVDVFSWDYVDGVQTPVTKTANVTLDHNKWYDVEVVIDLAENIGAKVTVYIDDKELITGAYLHYSGKYNNGNIGEIAWIIHRAGECSIVDEPTAENPILASFMIDDIEMKKIQTDITAITVADGQVTAISAYVGLVPTANQKFIVAAYETDATSGKTRLKDISFATTKILGTQNITLTKPLSVETGDVVKAFRWDLSTLVPAIGTMYTTTIQ